MAGIEDCVLRILRNIASVLLCLAIFFLYAMYANGYSAPIGNVETSVLRANSGNISVEVKVSRLNKPNSCPPFWGAENACPEKKVEDIRGRFSDEALYIPLSAFADLGNPRNVRIKFGSDPNRFSIVIVGGDAGTSYAATLKFEKEIIRERTVRYGEFPDESWERTIYMFNTGPR